MMLTIFTPTYNRATYLKRLYDSLLAQENKDFEWLIVDDGSTDETAQVVASFQTEQRLTIRFFAKENGGKHTAYNLALEKAAGTWFLCVDSDDFLSTDAVQRIAKATEQLPRNMGIAAYKADDRGNRLSDPFPEKVDSCKISELTFRHGCKGEFVYVFPTALAAEFPFPVFPGERFVTESVVYDRLEQVCSMKLLDHVVMICEYLEDGYSMNYAALMGRNPAGFCLYFLQRMDLMPSFATRVSCAGKYWAFRWISGQKSLRYTGKRKLAWALGAVVGVAFRGYYKFVRGI